MKQFESIHTEPQELAQPLATTEGQAFPQWPPISVVIALAVIVSLGLLGLVLGLSALLV